mmetsp:Transcript_41801/g.108272  ORF Transcript_41801/g.108272 Transcript_41801/m.108272 type:complete len:577 (+) Transcript_41801:98-1828(+)|eukprot:CAMPEP_0195062244 /NCGR_PEP_ID=MMETSP0448-20130528/8907_1 /TAXON_ID=66468 /ORGANISM="Heterocapsa triquestra, Strain CCMP 448" /LENGTH=576 /DNA_ID=CAMNT_0040092901 /DNA_START=86 /DNA_END=1816 /DNA_ORIENTATION=-
MGLTKFPCAVLFIIGLEFAERLCFYTFVGTQKTWLQDQGYSNSQSSSLNLIFSMISYLSCFFGGWMASTRVGRYKTVVSIAIVYVVGTYVSAVATLPTVRSVALYMLGTMVLITFGAGGIKPNVSTIGADQIDPKDPDAEAIRKSFFQYFYVSINLGSIISHGVLTSLAISGAPSLGIPVEHGFFFTYMIAASFMAIGLAAFAAGKRWYRHPAYEDGGKDKKPLHQFFETLRAGWDKPMGKVAVLGWVLMPSVIVVSVINAFAHSHVLESVTIVIDVALVASLVVAHSDNSWLPQGPVTKCLDCVPILLIGNIFYGILESSVGSFFQSQACQMDTRSNHDQLDGFQFSGDFFRMANPIMIIAVTPILDKVVYPTIEGFRGKEVGVNMKVTAGYCCAIIAQLIAACLESARRASPIVHGVHSRCAPLGPDGEHISPNAMSAYWMMIPYAMCGMGEIMVFPVLQHMAYEGSPPEMKSLLAAFNLFAMGALPNAMASAISQAFEKLVPNNLNHGNLGLVYVINSCLGLFGICIFNVVYRSAPKRLKNLKLAASENADTDTGDSSSEEEEESSESGTNSN